jgi:hypothetical protein
LFPADELGRTASVGRFGVGRQGTVARDHTTLDVTSSKAEVTGAWTQSSAATMAQPHPAGLATKIDGIAAHAGSIMQ